jgi:hypothetical protein
MPYVTRRRKQHRPTLFILQTTAYAKESSKHERNAKLRLFDGNKERGIYFSPDTKKLRREV